MSRRHSARTLEDLDDLNHEVEQWWSDYDTTAEPIEDWQEQWAATTLDVCEKVWSKQGARLYATHRDAGLRDDLQSWLLLRAQQVAAAYTPRWDAHDPERMWGAYLWKILNETAAWHFQEVIGRTEEARAAHRTTSANSGWGSTDELDARERSDGEHVERYALHGSYGIEDPLAVIIRLETFAEDIARAERHLAEGQHRWATLMPPTTRAVTYSYTTSSTCTVTGCAEPPYRRDLCRRHYEADRISWGNSKGYVCNIPDCGRTHKGRGLCQTHLAQHRRGTLAPELEQYIETTPRHLGGVRNNEPCTVDGCDERGEVRGMCRPHYAAARYQAKKATR